MKHRAFVLLSGTLTLGLGYWLAEHSRDSREIWLTVGAWILGYWFASRLLASPEESEELEDLEDEDEDQDGDEDQELEEEFEDNDEEEHR